MAVLMLVEASRGMLVLTAASNAVLQMVVVKEMHGPFLSLYTMVFVGFAPLGSLMAGTVATYLGAPTMVRVRDVDYLFGAVVFARLPTLQGIVRPLYIEMGLMQDTTIETHTMMDTFFNDYH